MDVTDVKEYLIDFQERNLPELVERELTIYETNRIITIIGPRRAGKTYFMYQKMRELLSGGINKENMLYLNFEDPRLVDVSYKEIRDIVKLHWQIYPNSSKKPLMIFVDEPQNIERWEVAIRSLHDEGFKVYLTGSSSSLLSREIATALRGRTVSYLLLPFSFREYLRMKKVEYNVERLSSRGKSVLLAHLNKYIEFGGFPEVIQEDSEENKLRMIKEYFNLVVYRDIVERYKIRNTMLVKWLMRTLISSFSKEFSIHRYYLTLKSRGVKVSKNTLYAYLSMLADVLFIFQVQKFDYSIRKRDITISKVYLNDSSFAKIGEFSRDVGRKMENLVFLELERRRKPLSEIFYWKSRDGKEVDFVIKSPGGVEELIQVCYDPTDIDTRKREIRALLKASQELKCRNLKIITWDYEDVEEIDGREIRFIPLWKWMLKY